MIWRYGNENGPIGVLQSVLYYVWYDMFFYHLKTHAQILETNMELITIIGFCKAIGLFQKYHLILFVVSPKFGGTYHRPKSNFWRDNKEYYGMFEKGLFNVVSF